MKSASSSRFLGSLLLLAALVGVWSVQGQEPAQSPPVAPTEIPEDFGKPRASVDEAVAAHAPYPVLNDLELMERMTDAGVKMMEDGTGKGSRELNEGLKCRSIELELAPVNEEPVSDADLYARACESIFVICGLFKVEGREEWDAAFATAFVVGSDGVLTTSRHFFDDPQPCDIILVADSSGKLYPVTDILCSDEKMDTCLFQIPAKDLKPLPIAKRSPLPGSRVRIVSHPGYFFYFFSSGQVGNYFKDDQGLRWMNVTADFGQGSSGAPAFDECGNVIGQVASTLTLYAVGSTAEDPIISRRHVTRQADGSWQVRPTAAKKPAAEPAGEDSPKKKKKKKKKDNPPEKPAPEMMPLATLEEIADPQMVFKTCTPLESLREMVK